MRPPQDIASTYDHRTLKIELPVRSAVLKQCTGGLVVRWVTTSEYPLLYVFGVCFCWVGRLVEQKGDARKAAYAFCTATFVVHREGKSAKEYFLYCQQAKSWWIQLGAAQLLHHGPETRSIIIIIEILDLIIQLLTPRPTFLPLLSRHLYH
jgi:hypothetical protein